MYVSCSMNGKAWSSAWEFTVGGSAISVIVNTPFSIDLLSLSENSPVAYSRYVVFF